MRNALPALAVAGTVMAALSALVLQNLALLLVPLLAFLAAASALLHRDRAGLLTGLVLALMGVWALLGAIGGVFWRGGAVDFGIDAATGSAIAVTASLAVAMSVLPLRWGQMGPKWLPVAGAVVAILAVIDAFAVREHLGDQSQLAAWGLAVLCLAAGVPALMALVRNRASQDVPATEA